MQLRLEDNTTRWGSFANGEHMSRVGTGEAEFIPVFVGYQWGYTIPVGTYTTVQVATLSF